MAWPPKCSDCGERITNWSACGIYEGRWLHKSCWAGRWQEARQGGRELAALRSPAENTSILEAPMFLFILMFHFGTATALMGWILLTQDSNTAGPITLAIGVAASLVGGVGAFANLVSRRRLEMIRRELELQGGWTPLPRPRS